MFDKAGKRVCVCMCWHVLDAIVEMSVISIYLFVRWHIKALNRKSHSVFFFLSSRLLPITVFIHL